AQDADAAAMGVGEATPGGGTGDRPSEGRLPTAPLPPEGGRWRCAACDCLCGGLQHPLAAAVDRVFACLDVGGGGIKQLRPPLDIDRGCGLTSILQGRLFLRCLYLFLLYF